MLASATMSVRAEESEKQAELAPSATVGTDDEATDAARCQMWVDCYRGEPIALDTLLDDLAGVGVVYLGERHRVGRHHRLQRAILRGLARRGVKLALAMEQLEAEDQPAVDRYNRGEISLDELAEAVAWEKQWPGYRQYVELVEAARQADAPVVALNAPREVIRQVFRGGGIAKLAPAQRRRLPEEVKTDDPVYRKLLSMQMAVHLAATPEWLGPMIEAQIARDEAMAAAVARFARSPEGRGRTVLVICGSGHVAFGLGTAARVRRRLPDVEQRIVIFSESGDVELTERERAVSREISISHQQLRDLGRPLADYLHVTAAKR
jgi:uncharacterized iron-regulated protein